LGRAGARRVRRTHPCSRARAAAACCRPAPEEAAMPSGGAGEGAAGRGWFRRGGGGGGGGRGRGGAGVAAKKNRQQGGQRFAGPASSWRQLVARGRGVRVGRAFGGTQGAKYRGAYAGMLLRRRGSSGVERVAIKNAQHRWLGGESHCITNRIAAPPAVDGGALRGRIARLKVHYQAVYRLVGLQQDNAQPTSEPLALVPH
jgi:hypothetical protein